MKQLSRKAFITFFLIAIAIFIIVGYKYVSRHEVLVTASSYQYEVLVNDAELKAKNLGVVNAEKSKIPYQKQTITLNQKEDMSGFKIDEPLTLEKIMQLKGRKCNCL